MTLCIFGNDATVARLDPRAPPPSRIRTQQRVRMACGAHDFRPWQLAALKIHSLSQNLENQGEQP